MSTATSQMPRTLTPAELGAVVRAIRETKKWSQQQLAEIAGLSTRTVQRVESGQPADFDTRRALGRAVEFDDIDAFNKPFQMPTPEELDRQREAFEKEYVTLKALPVGTGRELAVLAETSSADLCTPGFDMDREAQEVFAQLIDYLRDFRDCHDLYSEVQKLEVHDELQSLIDNLKALSISLRYATRRLAFKADSPEAKAVPASVLYLVTYPLGKEPQEFSTPRKLRMF